MKFTYSLFVFSLLIVSPAFAGMGEEKIIQDWYSALSPVDRNLISELLANDAEIELKDYDLVQNKEEFIESLDSWEDAIEGGSIAFKLLEQTGETMVSVSVCYSFSSNQLMTKEDFTLSDGKITKSSQITVSEDCKSF